MEILLGNHWQSQIAQVGLCEDIQCETIPFIVPTTTPIVNADEAESNSEIERDDGTRPPEGFSIIAPRRESK